MTKLVHRLHGNGLCCPARGDDCVEGVIFTDRYSSGHIIRTVGTGDTETIRICDDETTEPAMRILYPHLLIARH